MVAVLIVVGEVYCGAVGLIGGQGWKIIGWQGDSLHGIIGDCRGIVGGLGLIG